MSRSPRTKFDCPRCGAPLHAEGDSEFAHCSYCQEDVHVPWSVAPRKEKERERDSSPPPKPPTSGGGSGPVFAILGLAAVAGAFAFYEVHYKPTHGGGAGGPNDVPVTTAHDAAEDVEWDAANDPPVITRMGNDEDFVGAFWTQGKGESRKDHAIYVGFFDGTSHEREWYAGPFGRVSQSKGATHFGFFQGNVLVTDYRGTVYAFDAVTGKEQFSAKLPDRARSICVNGATIWIDVVGDRGVFLDPKSGATTSSPARPAGCPAPSLAPACEAFRGRAECSAPDKLPPVPGFKAVRVLWDGDDGVALGTSDSGKVPVPMAVGIAKGTNAVRWKANLPPDSVTNWIAVAPSVGEVSGGRAYLQYELKDTKWRLACLDTATGARVWDVVVPGSKHGDEARSLVLSSSRLYLSHGDWLDIFDIKTGGALGEFGR